MLWHTSYSELSIVTGERFGVNLAEWKQYVYALVPIESLYGVN